MERNRPVPVPPWPNPLIFLCKSSDCEHAIGPSHLVLLELLQQWTAAGSLAATSPPERRQRLLVTDTGVSRKRDCGFRVAGRSQRCGNSGEQNFRFIARRRLGRGISRQRHKSTSYRHESAGPTSTPRNRISRPRFHDGLGAPVRYSRSTISGLWWRYSCHPRRGSQNRPLAAPSAVPGLPGRRCRQRLPRHSGTRGLPPGNR